MTRRKSIAASALAALAVAAGVAAWCASHQRAGTPAAPADAAAGAPAVDGRAAPVAATRDAPSPSVAESTQVPWPASVPKSAPIATRKGEAYDTHVYADGTQTATIQVRDARTGESMPASITMRPIDPKGVKFAERGTPPAEQRLDAPVSRRR